jgi:iron complex transport system permease protein
MPLRTIPSSWTFGTLDDRTPVHVWIGLVGVGLAAAVIPFVALELDLFAGGEEDAETLGVDPGRIKLLALVAAALAAAVAVAVAGQIAFVGLVVPHLVRLTVGSSHRRLLPLCLVGGPVFLLGADVVQRWLLGGKALQPGVLMSLVGGPFFLFLLVRNKRALRAW